MLCGDVCKIIATLSVCNLLHTCAKYSSNLIQPAGTLDNSQFQNLENTEKYFNEILTCITVSVRISFQPMVAAVQ